MHLVPRLKNLNELCLPVIGAFFFIMLERPQEEIRKQTKLDKSLDVEDAIRFL